MASTREDGPRRVLIIVENLPVPFDRRVWNEATTLRDAGYEVFVICPLGKDAEERMIEIDGIRIYRHPLPEARAWMAYFVEYSVALFWEFLLAWRIWRRHGFDVIHACNPPDLIFLVGGFFKLIFGTKFVFDHHDISPELFEAKFGRRSILHRISVMLERCSFRMADISIATNESYRAIAVERGGKNPGRVFVVRSGCDLSRIKIGPEVPALKKGRRFLIGYVGVMGVQEGIQYLLHAARVIIRERGRTDVHFGLVGGGAEFDALRQMAEQLGIADFVTFTGRVADRDLLEMLNTADVCINPDECNPMNDKSTMNKIMEYMALGKPIVQFDVTEGRVSAQEASLYARCNDPHDLAERILELLADPERRRKMGEIGRRRAENELAWVHEAPKLLAAYESLFAAPAYEGGVPRSNVRTATVEARTTSVTDI